MIRIDMTFKPLPPNWPGLQLSPKLTSSHGHPTTLFYPIFLFSLPHPSALLQGLAHLPSVSTHPACSVLVERRNGTRTSIPSHHAYILFAWM